MNADPLLNAAPYHAQLADGPAQGRAVWLRANDGVRLRLAIWGEGAPGGTAKGTILLFPGRSEYAEKYGRTARDMLTRGYATVAIDWRGQGLADRALADRAIGHVGHFSEYQRDVAAMLAYVRRADLPGPCYLLAHSMGGCIGLRSLYEGLPVLAAGFSAPMWGITMAPGRRPQAWVLSTVARWLGFGRQTSPGQADGLYLLTQPFDDNMLTTDREMWDWMREQMRVAPELGLGGASLGWLNAALCEMWALARRPAPDLPCLTAVGTREKIVDRGRIDARMTGWPGGDLMVVEGAEHEIMMEGPDTRARFYNRLDALFCAARAAQGVPDV